MTTPLASPPMGTPIDRALLTEVFARPEFAHASTAVAARTRSWPERIAAWFEALMRSDAAFTAVTWTRAFVLSAVLLAAVWLVVRAFRRRAEKTPKPDQASPALPARTGEPQQALAEARRNLEGAPREAVRVGSVAALLWLARHNLCRGDQSHTNEETLAEIQRRGAPGEVTRAAAALFRWYDRAYYSLGPISRDEAQQFLGRVEALGLELESRRA